ncbi:MAG: nitroreductase family protein [Prevotellaceae bacterium]|jgi:nitroreductase|nr:nitroreductase family protein [Prevotellaceae bacterium]
MTANDLLELMNKRQSVRAYTDKLVEIEKLQRCLEAARIAPSACNAQPWKFIVINKADKPELHAEIAKAAASAVLGFNKFARQAPVLLVVVRESPNITSKLGAILKDKPYTIMDIGITVAHFCLQATAENLGACIMGWFDEKKVKKLLNIPSSKRVELILSLGYAAKDEIRTKIRKSMDKIVSYAKY